MAITVQHSPSPYLVGVGAYGAGVANIQQQAAKLDDQQAFEREQQQRSIQAAQQQQLVSLQAQFAMQAQQEQARAYAQQQAYVQQQQMAEYDQYASMERQYAQSMYDTQRLLDTQSAYENKVQFDYTQGQQQKLAQLNESYAYLDQQYASGAIDDWQLEQMQRSLDAEYMGIKKMPQTAGHSYPPGTEPGKVFYVRNDQDAQLMGLPPVVDPVTGSAIPLIRDPETGQIETLRGYPSGMAAVDKTEGQQAKLEQHQAELQMKAEAHQQDMQIKQQEAQMKAQQKQAEFEAKQQAQQQKNLAGYIQKRTAAVDPTTGASVSYEQAMKEGMQLFPTNGVPQNGMGIQQEPQQHVPDPSIGQYNESLPPDEALAQQAQQVLNPQFFLEGVGTGAFKNEQEAQQAFKAFTGLFQQFADYPEGAQAVLGIAELTQQYGRFENPMQLPEGVRGRAAEMIRTTTMSGRLGIPQPRSYQDLMAIPVGVRYLHNGQVKVRGNAGVAGPAQ